MSFDWKKIYEYNNKDNAKSGKKFESLAIEFLSDVFKDFTWIQTKASWDNNRDVIFSQKDGKETWGEAKYRKNSDNVGKKDLDPTILSGLIDGKVKMIIYISNGTIAEHNFERISYAANIRDIKVTYIGRYQLESWLRLNPKIYREYFGEELPIEPEQCSDIISIKSINFYNISSIDFRSFENKDELLVGEDYILCLTIYSNKDTVVSLKNDNFPFIIVEHPSFHVNTDINLSLGLNSVFLWVNIKEENTKPIIFEFETSNGESIIYCSSIVCVDLRKPLIVHTSQNDVLLSIDRFLTSSLAIQTPHIVTIHSDSGIGKTYLMELILKNYNGKFDISLIKFNDNAASNVNYILFCKIIIFLSFGNIFWNDDNFDYNEEDYKVYCENRKKSIINRHLPTNYSTQLLEKIYDGCFDYNIAKTAIDFLMEEISDSKVFLINPFVHPTNRILLLDDVHKLKGFQCKFFLTLLKHLESVNNNIVIFISYTHNKFTNKQLECSMESLTENDYMISNLSNEDLLNTINKNIKIKNNHLSSTQLDRFPHVTLFLEEVIDILRSEANEYNNDIEFLSKYNSVIDEKNIFTNKFTTVKKYFFIIDAIYIYKKGLSWEWISSHWGNQERSIKLLKSMNIIKESYGNLYPYHDILISSYYSLRGQNIYNSMVGDFFEYLLQESYGNSDLIDYNLLLSTLLLCGDDFYNVYIQQAVQKRDYYFNHTRFSEALFYAKAICDKIKQKKHKDMKTYSDDELYSCFVYADCLKHSGDIKLSNEEFLSLYDNSSPSSSIKYEAGAEVLNLAYRAWDMQLIDKIKVKIKIELSKLISGKKYTNKNDLDNRIIRAYYTCTNRLMLIAALKDHFTETQEIYRNALKGFIQTQPKDPKRIKSEIATYIMDYARTLYYINPNKSYHLMKKSLCYYKQNIDIHFRRILICEVDVNFLEGMCKDNSWDIDKFYKSENNLKNAGFKREYTKAVLKRCSCQLIEYFNEMKSSGTDAVALLSIREDIETAVTNINLEYAKRTNYLTNNIVAFIEIAMGNIDEAKKILLETQNLIKNLGESYRHIVNHNIAHMESITNIRWAFDKHEYSESDYLLDPRVW